MMQISTSVEYSLLMCFHFSLFTVEEFLKDLHKQLNNSAQGVHSIPTGSHIRDDEQVRKGANMILLL